ncbi:MAG: autotransporter-associated beta strand repeat-containing protein, partial [Opitutales bacterium]|nr:autotransporter-associated beta strand repeat-containing protein [Opitutales bacterium]
MNKNTSARLITALAALTLLGSTAAQAQTTYTWDTTIAADATITDGAGTWTTGAGNWNDGATSDGINWTDGDSAIFGGGTEGTAGTVVLGSNITTAATQTGISFSLPFDGSYTLDTSTFTLTTGGIKLNGGSAAVLIESTGVGGKIELNATNTWSISNGPLTVTSQITGAFGINKFGAGHMYLSNDNNSFTGALSLNNGGNTYLATIKNSGVNSAAGAGSKIIIGNNADLFYTGSGDSTDRTLQVGNANSIIYNNGTGALVFTGAFANTNNNTSTKTLTLGGSNTDANEIQGAIIDSTTNSNPLNLTKLDAGTWKLSGANTYTGKTLISTGTLQVNAADVAATSGALGNGGAIDFSGGTLQYSALSAGTDYGSRFGDSASFIRLDTNGQDVTLAS